MGYEMAMAAEKRVGGGLCWVEEQRIPRSGVYLHPVLDALKNVSSTGSTTGMTQRLTRGASRGGEYSLTGETGNQGRGGASKDVLSPGIQKSAGWVRHKPIEKKKESAGEVYMATYTL